MEEKSKLSSFILGVCIFLGLAVMGHLLGSAAIEVKEYERTVTAKGLSEREYPADIVIWPIQFSEAANDITDLYDSIDSSTLKIQKFLRDSGIKVEEISFASPSITDKSAQQYGDNNQAKFRYIAQQTVTVYSNNVTVVRDLMSRLTDLGKQGIVFAGDSYQMKTEYIFTRLNEIKPEMIEEATRNAREVAMKFAADSASKLGKIKTASQGQFSIEPRDNNNPHIKKVRVVSTVAYYLSD